MIIKIQSMLFGLALFFITGVAAGQDIYQQYFTNASLRFDYYQVCTKNSRKIVFSKLIQEPDWGGSKVNMKDTFNYGEFRVVLSDSATGTVIYSRGYSTLSHEWRSTPEAAVMERSFEETVTTPFPKKTVKLEIQGREKDMSFSLLYQIYVNPADPYIKKDLPLQRKWYYTNKAGDPSTCVDVVIIPDGYTKSEIEKMRKDGERFTSYLLGSSPLKENRKKINVILIEAISEQSGTDKPGEGIWANTVVGTNFYTFGSDRYLTVGDYHALRDVGGQVPYDQILIVVNTPTYGGGGVYNFFSSVSSDNIFSEYVTIHEFGHSFAGLGDEYYDSEVAVEEFYSTKVEPWEPNITSLVDFSKKWKSMVPAGVPVPTPFSEIYSGKVGVFEGAGYSAKGLYRPYPDCSMKSIKVDAFCPVCRNSILSMILFYSK